MMSSNLDRNPAYLALGALGLFLILLGLAGCSSTQRVQSDRPSQPIALDGDLADWAGDVRAVEDETGISMGVKNDADAVYVTLVVRNTNTIRQIARGGLTLWLDPEGEKQKALGVRFPLPDGDGARGPSGTGGRRGDGGEPPSEEEMERLLGERLSASLSTYEIVRDGAAEGARLAATDPGAVGVGGTYDRGELVLEYRIPLGGEADYALAAVPGDEVGLGFATPDVERPSRPQGGRAGRGGGGMGGRGGRGGGQRNRPDAPEPLNAWTRVELASAEQTGA